MTRPIQLRSQEEIDAERDKHFEQRAAHLQWCKDRALAYLDQGEVRNAYTSFLSDAGNKTWMSVEGEQPPIFNAREGTGAVLMQLGALHAVNHDAVQMRYWVEGFN